VNRSHVRIAGAVLVLVLLVAIAVLGNRIFTAERRGPAGTEALGDEPLGLEIRTLTLYFGARDSVALAAERRDIQARPDLTGNLSGMMADLAAGPLTDLVPVIPAGTRVRHVFVDPAGTVYIDFSGEIQSGLDGGLSHELMVIRSIARTMTVNFTGLNRLQILVDGRIVPSLGGHLDTSRPLALAEWD
jgi:hypothetical protein